MTSPAVPDARPLNPGRLRLVPAPDLNLPYDDERPGWNPAGLRPPSGAVVGVQGTLALDFQLPTGVPAVPAPSPRLRVVGGGVGRGPGEPAEADDAPSRPDASRWVALLAQAIVDAEVGDRPVTQLARWTTEDVYDTIARRCSSNAPHSAVTRRATARAVVASVHICAIGADVVEASATVRRAARARAVALRLEGVGDAWRCPAVSLG